MQFTCWLIEIENDDLVGQRKCFVQGSRPPFTSIFGAKGSHGFSARGGNASEKFGMDRERLGL